MTSGEEDFLKYNLKTLEEEVKTLEERLKYLEKAFDSLPREAQTIR